MFSEDTALHEEITAFLANCRTLVLATSAIDADFPDASYAPYVTHQGDFFILISQLATHTRNLLAKPACHVLFIADEQGTANIFARKRVSFRCQASEMPREHLEAEPIIDQMQDRFGPIVGMIRGLGDFRLIQLKPDQGLFVKGFGQAFKTVASK